ncbi:hypothetical protein CTM53_11985 [Prevotella intermedia]|uniref:FMN-binding domain-containing protein n=1 Tax=Prevotella intermedia TaxID=28131 RepID=A0AAJ3RS57_PREIN|nr:4Fe-4S binding protein [Prevotella intermedia]ATV55551.1 hypothetical protein CTM61_09040 [Prevotella intermedia]PJI19343.1 hypothetical protein CTM53_11985 [Prevotella intermedia]
MKKLQQILMLATCMFVLMVAAIQRDGKVWGRSIKTMLADSVKTAKIDTMRTLDDGTKVINTTELGKDIVGYSGAVPLDIYIKDGKVVQVKALKNAETPEFFEQVKPLLTKWNGKTIEQAQALKVDAVSGATFSSHGIIGNMHQGLAYAEKKAIEPTILEQMNLDAKAVAGLLVVLLAATIPLFYRSKRYHTVQLLLNVVVLGFGCGTFLSWTLFINFMSSGINFWASLVPIIMLITAFVYPLFGKKNYYCTNVCPCGAFQDLAAKTKNKKWRMGVNTVKRLNAFRKLLFAVLLVLTLSGIWFEWIDYEVFSAFIFQTASVFVLVLGGVVAVLSFFVPRPYCRFVCPTGTFFKIAEHR